MSSCKCHSCSDSEYININKLLKMKYTKIVHYSNVLCKLTNEEALEKDDEHLRYKNLPWIIKQLQGQVKDLYDSRDELDKHSKDLHSGEVFNYTQSIKDMLKAPMPSYTSLIDKADPTDGSQPTLNDPFAPFRYALSESNMMQDGCPSEIDVADAHITYYYNYNNTPADPNTFAGGLRLKAKCWCCQKDITPTHMKKYDDGKIRITFTCHGKTEVRDFTEEEMIAINKDEGYWQPFML